MTPGTDPAFSVAPERARPPEAVQAPTTKCPENPAEGLVDVRHPSVRIHLLYQQLLRSAKMSVLTKLQEDMKIAMKSGQKERLSVIRMLISDVKNIDLAPKKISEEEAVAAYGKKLRKSVEEYEKLGKPAEVAQLKAELAVVEEDVPKEALAAE